MSKKRGQPKKDDHEVKKLRSVRVSDKHLDMLKAKGYSLQEIIDATIFKMAHQEQLEILAKHAKKLAVKQNLRELKALSNNKAKRK